MRPFHRPTKHTEIRENSQRNVEKRKQLYCRGQEVRGAKVLQHSIALYSFLYIHWLQLAAENGGCNLRILMSSLMSLVNFFLSSHCTVDKDILPGNIMKLRVYVGQLSAELDPKATDKQY